MAWGAKTQDVIDAVNECNDAIHGLDASGLDLVSDLNGYSNDLKKIWQTENGEASINNLNEGINELKEIIDSMKQAAESIKNDNYTYTFSYSSPAGGQSIKY